MRGRARTISAKGVHLKTPTVRVGTRPKKLGTDRTRKCRGTGRVRLASGRSAPVIGRPGGRSHGFLSAGTSPATFVALPIRTDRRPKSIPDPRFTRYRKLVMDSGSGRRIAKGRKGEIARTKPLGKNYVSLGTVIAQMPTAWRVSRGTPAVESVRSGEEANTGQLIRWQEKGPDPVAQTCSVAAGAGLEGR